MSERFTNRETKEACEWLRARPDWSRYTEIAVGLFAEHDERRNVVAEVAKRLRAE